MSWQAYVDDHLMYTLPGGGQLEHAAIVGQDGLVWAQSANFPEITAEEVQALVHGFKDTSQLAMRGIWIGQQKYMFVGPSQDGLALRGKTNTGGVTVKKTNSALVIGIYGPGVTAAECNVAVEKLGDYLIEQSV